MSQTSASDSATTPCVFCAIVRGDLPAFKVYEDEHVLAFLDKQPLTRGHTLLIPKKHYRELRDMPPAAMAALGARLPLVADAVVSGMNADNFNILQNNGLVAGQMVFHVHFHIIPRYKDDRHWPRSRAPLRSKLDESDADAQVAAMRARL